MLLPAVIAIILFSYLPLRGLVIAFLDYSPVRGDAGSTWVGFANFQTMFQNPFFAAALRNTLTINTLKLLLGFPSAIILALLLNEARLGWFKRTVQTATILPYFISWVVAATMFRSILAPEGVLNEIITHVFGAQAVVFLSIRPSSQSLSYCRTPGNFAAFSPCCIWRRCPRLTLHSRCGDGRWRKSLAANPPCDFAGDSPDNGDALHSPDGLDHTGRF